MDLSSKIISMRATIISWSTFLFSSIGYIFMREHFHQYSEYTYCNFSNRTLTDPSECLLCLVWTSWLSILHHSHLGFVPCTHGHMFRRWIRGCCTLKVQSDGLRPVWYDTGALGHVVVIVCWSTVHPARPVTVCISGGWRTFVILYPVSCSKAKPGVTRHQSHNAGCKLRGLKMWELLYSFVRSPHSWSSAKLWISLSQNSREQLNYDQLFDHSTRELSAFDIMLYNVRRRLFFPTRCR